jgi:hypothetical protein
MKALFIKAQSKYCLKQTLLPLLVFSLLISTTSGQLKSGGTSPSAPMKITLEQIRNGSATSRLDPGAWVNGNLNGSQAHYAEQWSIPYRMVFTGLPIGVHTLVIEWDIRQGSKMALDYVTDYNLIDNAPGSHMFTFGHLKENIDPTIGVSGLGLPVRYQLPVPSSAGSPVSGQPAINFNSITTVNVLTSKTVMTIYNGIISAMTYPSQGSLSASASASQLQIVFTNTSSTCVLAWGGHIAAQAYWGAGNSASAISGSPYHMRLISIDGSGGNLDRSLSADAVVDPPPCIVSGAASVCPGSTTTYKYDPDNDGVANDLPSGYTALWSFSGSANGASIVGSATGNSVQVLAGACGSSFTIQVLLTNSSGTVGCSEAVTVGDATAPTITSCPADAVVECIGDTAASNTGVMTATDACGVTITHSNSVQSGCATVITRTWTATDACGNTSTCIQHIIVRDRTAPSISCNTYPAAPTVSDNCTATGSITVYYRDNGTTRTWTAVDASGNSNTCSQTIPAAAPAPPAQTSVSNNSSSTQNAATTAVPTPSISNNGGDIIIKATPNPFSNEVNFHFVSEIGGQANLDIYNMLGIKVASVFNGKVDVGIPYNVKYRPAKWSGDQLIYRITVAYKSVSGRLLRTH